jgi:hypothetical protein
MFRSPADESEFERAESEYAAGRWCQALRAFAAYLDRRLSEGGSLTGGDQVAAERAADLALLCERPEAAARLLGGLEQLNRDCGDDFLADYFALKAADAAVLAGAYPTAEAALRRLGPRIGPLEDLPTEPALLPEWEKRCQWPGRRAVDRPIVLTRLYLAAGGWLAGNGFYRHAVAVFARGAELAVPPEPPLACRARVRLKLALAAAHLEHGSPDRADVVLQALESAIDGTQNPGWRADWLGLSGHLALLTGRYGTALDRLSELTELCRAGGFVGAARTALLHRAQVLISMNLVLAAEDLLAVVVELAEATGDAGALARAQWLRWLARARGDSPLGDGKPHSVTALWDGWPEPGTGTVLPPGGPDPAALPAVPNFLAFFEDRALAVRWRAARGELDEAENLLADLRRVFAPSDSLLIRLRLDALRGVLAYARGNFSAAACAFAELALYFERQGLRPELRDVLRFQWWSRLRAAAPAGAEGDTAARVVPVERNPEVEELGARIRDVTDKLADSLPAAERAVWMLDKWADEERVLAAEVVDLDRARTEAEAAPWWKRFWRHRALRRRVAAYLDRLDDYRRRTADRAAGVAGGGRAGGPQPRPPRDRLNLIFQVFPDFTLVIRAGGGRLDARMVPLTRLRARELVARWHRRVKGDWSHTDDPAPVAEELATALRLPDLLADLPTRLCRLAIVADDALHGFPFAALRIGGRYLIERFALSHQSGAGPDRPGAAVSAALVAAVPDGAPPSDQFPDGVPPLPHTVAEGAEAARRLDGLGVTVDTRAGADLDPQTLLAALAATDFAHIACHGVFLPDEPDRSGLIVVGRTGVGRLTLRDLYTADLSRVEHLTLSCCWGADNFVYPGRRVLSLPEAATRAGAGSVLAALWPVHDAAGREFADRFLAHLREHPRDVALQRTQCDFLRSVARVTDPATGGAELPVNHPFYWSGYRLLGRTERLRWPSGRGTR